MVGTWIQAAVAPLLALLIVWRGTRGVGPSFLAKWQARFDVEVPSSERNLVLERLRQARSTRSVMAGIGVAVAGLPSYMNLIDVERAAAFANPIVEYAWLLGATLGALAAEVFVIQRPSLRLAALFGRRPSDYLNLRWVWLVCFAVPLAVVLAVASTALDAWRWWYAWVGVGGALIATAALLLGLRAITDRAALAPGGNLRNVDDALRADGAHHLAGAALALAWNSVAIATPELVKGSWALLSLATGILGILAVVWWWTLARDVRWSVARVRSLA